MIHFHSLRVGEIRKETDDCVSVTFDVPEELKDTFRFKQGQSLTLRKKINGEELRRNYSICSAPFEKELRIAVKMVKGGIFSTYINVELKEGEYLDVMPPSGRFYTELNSAQKKSYVAFAAGSGITPIISIIKATLITEPNSNFTLVYGNRSKNSILFKEELESIKDKYLSRFRVYHILSREKTEAPINYGRIDKDKLNIFFEKIISVTESSEFFLCGPEEMIFCIKTFLEKLKVNKEKIHFELFTIPGEKQSVKQVHNHTETVEELKSAIRIKSDGVIVQFDLEYNGNSILEAALEKGVDLPYACKGGVCTTCKARLKEGKIHMDVNWSLEPDELEKGYILTCQSRPLTKNVMIDFDEK